MKLLAILVSAGSATSCLDAAAIAARALPDARVEALHVKVDPDHMVAASEEIDLQRLRERAEGTPDQRAEAVRSAYLAWAAAAGDGPPVQFRVLPGAEEDVVSREAETSDVIALVEARDRGLDADDALHAAIFHSRRPVLLVPRAWRSEGRHGFRHVAVGLADSAPTRHAIEGARPWLAAAERVTAIRVGEDGDALTDLVRLLRSAGPEPDLHVVSRDDKDVGTRLIAEANAVEADLLVVGAYRYPHILEWLFGGTSYHLLKAANLPLLVAH